jgi:hypothetical protein
MCTQLSHNQQMLEKTHLTLYFKNNHVAWIVLKIGPLQNTNFNRGCKEAYAQKTCEMQFQMMSNMLYKA